ncbi:hypothetical protein SAMN05444401_1230 [Clostridium amylolyticum]|uniref:Uncharacterized protein n=1 Tax=Clostridium amylolyticum TaxID=1121298 RepID=A0A1M6CT68_9CLOT|nr:hypothetical protein SAMN05444401_1230 [Clostridium amylolyticum]
MMSLIKENLPNQINISKFYSKLLLKKYIDFLLKNDNIINHIEIL